MAVSLAVLGTVAVTASVATALSLGDGDSDGARALFGRGGRGRDGRRRHFQDQGARRPGPPSVGRWNAIELAQDEDVVGVVGPLRTSVAQEMRTVPTVGVQGYVGARFLYREAKKTKAYVIDGKETFGSSLAAGFKTEFRKVGGTVVGADHVGAQDKDFSALVAEVKQSGAEVVYYGGGPAAARRLGPSWNGREPMS